MTSREPDADSPRWYKSSFSTGQNDCVEVAAAPSTVLIRDSKNPDGGLLSVSARAWTSFITAIKRGQLD